MCSQVCQLSSSTYILLPNLKAQILFNSFLQLLAMGLAGSKMKC